MPTLFTALRAHAQRQRAQPKKRQTTAPFPLQIEGQPVYTAEILGLPIEAPRPKRKLKEPARKMSLRDRFLTNREAAGRRTIIIVGGGFAGLSAAYELESLGYEVIVLEGQAEVGGRVKSCRDIVRGNIMEKGAELIGVNHPAWWSYKRKFDLHFYQLTEPVSPPVFLDGARLYGDEPAKLWREMDEVQTRINRVARHVNAYEPWKSRNASALDSLSLAQALSRMSMSRRCRLAFTEQLQTDNGVLAEKQSWLGNLAMIKGGGLSRFWTDTETHHCVEGNQSLAFAFKKALKRVKLNAEVKSIEILRNRVKVRLLNQESFEGDDVVVAVPPTMWKSIRFEPALPAAFSVQFGNNVKFLLNVQKGSWRPEDPDMISDGPVDLTWDGTDGQVGKRAGLVAFSGADDALTCRQWGKARYLKQLATVYPQSVKTCGKAELMDWTADKWTKGSYSFPKPGGVTEVGPLLHSGFLKRVHFAGEHTCYAFTGYMEAALQSGLRVAERIARRDRVLGRKRRTVFQPTRLDVCYAHEGHSELHFFCEKLARGIQTDFPPGRYKIKINGVKAGRRARGDS
jgi:monoamine oxidase